MYKFTKQFFLLFLLVTVIPVFLMILWNIYSTHNVSETHLQEIFNNQAIQTNVAFMHFKKRKLNNYENLVQSLSEYNLNLDKYRKIFNEHRTYWINVENSNVEIVDDSKKIESNIILNKTMIEQPISFFEVIFNKETKKYELVTVIILPLKTNKHAGLLVMNAIPFETLLPGNPPKIYRIYKGTEYKKSNIIAKGFKMDYFKEDEHKNKVFPPPPPPPENLDIKIKGDKFTLKSLDDQPVATVEMGVPDVNKPFWFFHHPMQRDIFKKVYLLGFLVPVLGIILSLLVGFYYKKHFIDPVDNLSTVSKVVGLGDLNVRVNTDTNQKEIKETLINFNKMLDSIKEKEQLKESFITNLTHDLRTPLLAEQRTFDIMLEQLKETSNSKLEEILQGLQNNNEHLLNMVNLLLETYQFEEGKLNLDMSSINIKELMEQCIVQLNSIAKGKNILLQSNLNEKLPLVIADYNYLKRIFLNLIINAIENIPKGSVVEVFASVNNEHLEINIKDNGPGISEDISKHLFDRYFAGKKTERKIGSGLGLYICKKFIEAHGGSIRVDSVEGKYSNFIVSIPIVKEEKNS
ncbi:MAG: HAMP domain-containing sensor histidine kinase [Cyanobacteriota bacterium]